MTSSKMRDRDAIVTRNDMIFRVYGYSHPRSGYVCDPEYAPADIYSSTDPRAYRAKGHMVYYKFYTDEGLRFVRAKFPEYMVWHPSLQRRLVGVKEDQIKETREPQKALMILIKKEKSDQLLEALGSLMSLVEVGSGLSVDDFGVFGSLLHGFYHPAFSDLDFTISGRNELQRLRETLTTLHGERDSLLRNEFDSMKSVAGKEWKFRNFGLSEYVWHQRRKRIYCVFDHKKSGRIIKAEFEPVMRWEEIRGEDLSDVRIGSKGWTKILARVTEDKDAAFMPSVYPIEPVEVLDGPRGVEVERVVSFVEEFRLQAEVDELVLVEGNLERVEVRGRCFDQVTLSCCPRYYEQVLKVVVG